MDSLSTTHPVSSLLPKSFPSPNPISLVKPPPPSTANLNPPHPLSTKANHPFTPLSTSLPTFPPTSTLKPTLQTHRKAATGYAAALLDVACCDNALSVAARDARKVKRIVHVVSEDERVEEGRKGEVVRRAVEGGGLYVKLVVLVRMLANHYECS